jgi:hypothetical protein
MEIPLPGGSGSPWACSGSEGSGERRARQRRLRRRAPGGAWGRGSAELAQRSEELLDRGAVAVVEALR